MGLNIGPITSALSALRNAPEFGQARLRGNETPRPLSSITNREAEGPGRRQGQRPDAVRAGFGEGTISPLSAALRTIDRTIERVRENQPTIDDIREQFQARAAERRAALRNAREDEPVNAFQVAEPRGQGASRLIQEFAATDDPEPGAFAAPETEGPAGRVPAIERADELASALEVNERIAPARPDAVDVRRERIEAVREQDRGERPRLDVRV